MNEYMEIYMAEAKELLDDMNEALLLLERDMEDKSLVNRIFRAAHTIKGNSASMGFKKLESLTHGMEDLLQDIREGKVEADAKIMQLLYVCHDFIENGLGTIMQTGSEEEMNIDGILEKLHLMINNSSTLDYAGFRLEDNELDSLKSSIDAGEKAYLVKLGIAAECIFKPVRVWMWCREMDAYLTIIKSEPELPDAAESNGEMPAFEGNIVKMLVVTALDRQQLSVELDKLLDTSEISIQSFVPDDGKGKQIKLVMARNCLKDEENPDKPALGSVSTAENDRLIEIKSEFENDFIKEILLQLAKIEEQLSDLTGGSEFIIAFNKLIRLFHTVKGLAGFIGSSCMANISGAAEILLESYRSPDFNAEIVDVELITGSVAFIRKLCEEQSLSADAGFRLKAEEHLRLLKGGVDPKSLMPEEEMCEKESGRQTDKTTDMTAVNNTEATNTAANNTITDKTAASKTVDIKTAKPEGNGVKALENSFIRVSTQKIDSLVDMLGELLIQYSLMEQEASGRFDSNDRFMNNLLRMAKVIKGVQNISMSLRMVVLKQALQKTMRVGRDTAAELGKQVEISISGEETEIDRNIADKLVDPLMHLVRNSVSHGIEDGETRRNANKPTAGQIHIRAYSKRGYVYIEVEDDGGGLSIDRIRNKAIEKELIEPDKSYSNDEIIRLIFLPGFSTQEAVNNISGRGVGMNVVETEIKKVGGKIDIINKPGKGCCFILKIPLNLAVMNGTIVDIFGGRYIIPTLYIKQFVKPEASQWLKVRDQKSMIRLRDQVYPIIPVGRIFGRQEPLQDEDENMVVIIEVEQKFKALPVRNVTGRQEIVAKPLDKELGGLDFASGASILGDGRVSLILDVEAMFKADGSQCQAAAY